MAAPANASTSADINFALDQEAVMNFNGEYDRLANILGIFGVETMPAGYTLNQLKVTGTLNDSKTDDSSSGDAYVEGDLVALSKFMAEKVPVGTIKFTPYRKQVTAQAILESGYEAAVLRTDAKMLSKARSGVLSKFFNFLANGTGTASGTGLQAALANVDAALGDALEANDDEGQRIVHFINRQDAAKYLGEATITDQSVFGMTYLQNFLGVADVFLTSKVPAGTIYATPVENIHVYGMDFGALASAGLSYTQDSNGLIGVAHESGYDHASAIANLAVGALFFPEVTDYIIKGTVAAKA